MKIQALVVFSIALSGCATGSPFHVSCSGPYEPDPQAVEERVLAAHRSISPSRVLKCVSTPGLSGWSDDPDEEACAVVLDPAENAAHLIAFYSQRRDVGLPQVVSELASDLAPLRQVRGHSPHPAQKEPLLFTTEDSGTAILYAPHTRCLVLEEIT